MNFNLLVVLLSSVLLFSSCNQSQIADNEFEIQSSFNITSKFMEPELKLEVKLDSFYFDQIYYKYSLYKEIDPDLDTLYFVSYKLSSLTSSSQCYYSMACSFSDFFESNNPNYKILDAICYQNFPILKFIDENEKFRETLVIKKLKSNKDSISLNFKYFNLPCDLYSEKLDDYNPEENDFELVHSNKLYF